MDMTAPGQKDYGFPGTPYEVQERLMNALYATLSSGQIGLFESPTGTGKTLSIICSTLTWLSENRHSPSKLSASHAAVPKANDCEPDWVVAHAKQVEAHKCLDAFKMRRDTYHRRVKNSTRRTTRKKARNRRISELDDIISDSEDDNESVNKQKNIHTNLRIVFATRTHSQLQQFLDEIRRTQFASLGVNGTDKELKIDAASADAYTEIPLSMMLFGSRKQFCINKEVRALDSSGAIAERCRELTESAEGVPNKKRSRNKCQYKNAEAEEILRDRAITQMHSIEELAAGGEELGACPYFATRAALETGEVDVIGVPYSAVLHGPTRDSLGLVIDENTAVVFDEAHNIVNTVCDLHSAVLTRPGLVQTIGALMAYTERYETRFTSSNLYKLRQLLTLAKGLLSLLPSPRAGQRKARVVQPSSILFEAGVDNINMYMLVAYVQESMLCKKLRGFVDSGLHSEPTQSQNNKKKGMKTAHKKKPFTSEERDIKTQRATKQGVLAFENFLRCISDCSPDGRVALYPYAYGHTAGEEAALPLDSVARMKYFVVAPGNLFAESMSRARAILMLGGTLSPRAAIKQRLLGKLSREVLEFECDHVVPAENVMTRVCAVGPSGGPLEFTYRMRRNVAVTDELGRAVAQCISAVDGGVVMFVASYEHLRETLARWRETGMLQGIDKVKSVFVEERGSNKAFGGYQDAVRNDKRRGAILIGVMGGKLSEGINFSDELGRMVIMVGMPFANAAHVETGEILRGVGGRREQSELLENECLTIVNQCIGRAVRHANDFATIVLMDRRYGRERVMEKLPTFVRRDLQVAKDISELQHSVKDFFLRRRGAKE